MQINEKKKKDKNSTFLKQWLHTFSNTSFINLLEIGAVLN
jgi:hypothetical protein